jgi:hypothetical protein
LLLFVLVFLAGCSGTESITTSYIKILEKEIVKQEYFITVEDPNNLDMGKFKVVVQSEDTYNLILVDGVYLASYSYKTLDNGAKLNSIQLPDSGN